MAADGTVHSLGSAEGTVEVRLEPNALRLLRVRSGAAARHGTTGPAERDEHDRAGWSRPQVLESGWLLEIPDDAYEQAGTSREIAVTCGWERQGLSTYAGAADYVRQFAWEQIGLAGPAAVELTLPAVAGGASLSVNGTRVAERAWSPYRFTIPAERLRPGPNELRIRLTPSAANRYYAGTGLRSTPEPCGLLAPPTVRHRTAPPSRETDH